MKRETARDRFDRMPKVDWPEVLRNIAYLLGDELPGSPAREPVGTRLLAAHLCVPRTTVRGWMDGQVPKGDQAAWLIGEWCLLTGKSAGFAPITVRTPSPAKVKERA